MKCLLIASTQCNRKLCNIALVPSITTNTATVRENHTTNPINTAKIPRAPENAKQLLSVMFHKTMDSC